MDDHVVEFRIPINYSVRLAEKPIWQLLFFEATNAKRRRGDDYCYQKLANWTGAVLTVIHCTTFTLKVMLLLLPSPPTKRTKKSLDPQLTFECNNPTAWTCQVIFSVSLFHSNNGNCVVFGVHTTESDVPVISRNGKSTNHQFSWFQIKIKIHIPWFKSWFKPFNFESYPTLQTRLWNFICSDLLAPRKVEKKFGNGMSRLCVCVPLGVWP